MNKETLKKEEMIPYLPYSLKVEMEGKKCNVAWMSTKNIAVIRPDGIGDIKKIKWEYAHLNIKAYLRPLSRLTQEIEHRGVTFMPYNFLSTCSKEIIDYLNETENCIHDKQLSAIPHHDMEKLHEWHFDTKNLIPRNLALEIKE